MLFDKYLNKAASPPGNPGICSTDLNISGGGGAAGTTAGPLPSPEIEERFGSMAFGSSVPSIFVGPTTLFSSGFGGSGLSSSNTSSFGLITGGVNLTVGFTGGGGAVGGGGGGGSNGSNGGGGANSTSCILKA